MYIYEKSNYLDPAYIKDGILMRNPVANSSFICILNKLILGTLKIGEC